MRGKKDSSLGQDLRFRRFVGDPVTTHYRIEEVLNWIIGLIYATNTTLKNMRETDFSFRINHNPIFIPSFRVYRIDAAIINALNNHELYRSLKLIAFHRIGINNV